MPQGKHPLRSVAWLALLAIALIVVMPVLSRSLPMAAMQGMDADCPVHHTDGGKHPSSPHAPADPTERCGYCALLHHSPALAAHTAIYLPAAAPPEGIAAIRKIGDKPATPRLSADPRGPPAA